MRVGISSRSLSPPPAESVLDLYSTVEVVQQQSGHSELTDNVQEILLEAQHNANYKDTLDCISGHGSRSQGVNKCKLKPVIESLLRGWFQPKQKILWSEQKLFSKLNSLKFTLEQQSLVDSGIQMDQ